ncbi:pyridine nucleotide-disulfide oxidoreductase [Mycobacterium gallinarum]|uniref:Pyridine nucleotide-disulfide oxidoreductase n=1 Tax=Mycobacterium gallinarum TaxID=39689 RepID=A0A9W4FH10_9MYCO|nr:FAD-dependent oxidoreductase [Mycobacterium gallinarum]BBY94599.1 pyridine nucleotide-disulfide oxidoreductase [Mycobacterium gallinarum]
MSARQTFVIVGAGLAGAKAAEALRSNRFDGKVILIGDETYRPYDRPPLSKGYLLGSTEREKIYIHPAQWHLENDIDLRLGTRVTEIDCVSHKVSTAQGWTLDYDKLLLTTGSRPRRLQVPGAQLPGVQYLRRVADSDALRAAFAAAQQVAVIGAGWIGLETAAAAREAGCHVTLLERGKLPLLGVLGAEVAETCAALHRAHDVELRPNAEVAEIIGDGDKAAGVRLAGGDVVPADAVVIGVGATPNTELADAAGLPLDNGIVVDEHLVTADSDVFAAGDVANSYYPMLGTHLRLEHWSAAINQGPVAAANMMGTLTSYDHVPYFFSDQYDCGMEYSGYVGPDGYDEVVFRGDVASGDFIAFWLRERRVLAGMNVNTWGVTDAIEALVRSGAHVDAAKLADPDVPLMGLAGKATHVR